MGAELELLKAVQERLAEKDEIIREQQRQIQELLDGAGATSLLAEKDEIIAEQMAQILELSEQLESSAGGDESESELVIAEQMKQILELGEEIERLQQLLDEKE